MFYDGHITHLWGSYYPPHQPYEDAYNPSQPVLRPVTRVTQSSSSRALLLWSCAVRRVLVCLLLWLCAHVPTIVIMCLCPLLCWYQSNLTYAATGHCSKMSWLQVIATQAFQRTTDSVLFGSCHLPRSPKKSWAAYFLTAILELTMNTAHLFLKLSLGLGLPWIRKREEVNPMQLLLQSTANVGHDMGPCLIQRKVPVTAS